MGCISSKHKFCHRFATRCRQCCPQKNNNNNSDETTPAIPQDTPRNENNNVSTKRSSSRRPPRISVTLTTNNHLKLLKSVNELQDAQFDMPSVDLHKEEANAVFIQGLENPMKYNAGSEDWVKHHNIRVFENRKFWIELYHGVIISTYSAPWLYQTINNCRRKP